MNRENLIPMYAPDGRSLGFRTVMACQRLIANGYVRPAYGRKGHLRAIFLLQEDGGNPVAAHAPVGSQYSYRQHLDSGHRSWRLRQVDGRDQSGMRVSLREAFVQVVRDCLKA